jgi:hypothetical protein
MSMTTTADPQTGETVLLRAHRSEAGWLVSDCVTTRFGFAPTLAAALQGWHDDLAALVDLDGPLGPPIAGEAKWARAVLRGEAPA